MAERELTPEQRADAKSVQSSRAATHGGSAS